MKDSESLFGHGLGVALTTPFDADGSLDEATLARQVHHVVAGGVDFLVALGSTGEASLLDATERARVLEVVSAHRGATRLVVGVGAPSTRATVALAREAQDAGADGVLVAAPPYVKPTVDGVVAHFAAVAEGVGELPVIAYNVPSRNGVQLDAATVQRLWELPNVVALKESSGDIAQIARIAANLPAGRLLLAGDDALLLPTVAVGGSGVVSVAANVVPDAIRELLWAATAGDLAAASFLNKRLLPLFDALCAEPNPMPIKAAQQLAGLGGGGVVRLPLLSADADTLNQLRLALQAVDEAVHHA